MSVIEADPLFTQDIVHDFIISKGGNVTNKILVKHFRSFLNDPTRNVANREKFKTYVNTLSIIKVNATGEKVLVLKPKYKNGYATPKTDSHSTSLCNPPIDSSERPKKKKSRDPSFLERSSASNASPSRTVDMHRGNESQSSVGFASPPTQDLSYADPVSASASPALPSGANNSTPQQRDVPSTPASQMSPEYLKLLSQADLSTPQTDLNTPQTDLTTSQALANKNDRSSDPATIIQQDMPSSDSESFHSAQSSNNPRRGSAISMDRRQSQPDVTPIKPREIADKDEIPDDVGTPNENDSSFSVKDRAKQLNTIKDENQSTPSRQVSMAASDRSNNRTSTISNMTVTNGDTEPTISPGHSHEIRADGLITGEEKQWMLSCVNGDYHMLAKMVSVNPLLVNFKDISMGYTALHWASKKGNVDILKLLCGTEGININTRSNGGYTACHIAAKNNHNEMLNMLTQSYGADKDIRDYSGRRFKHYLGMGPQLMRTGIFKVPPPPAALAIFDSTITNRGLRDTHNHQPQQPHHHHRRIAGLGSSLLHRGSTSSTGSGVTGSGVKSHTPSNCPSEDLRHTTSGSCGSLASSSSLLRERVCRSSSPDNINRKLSLGAITDFLSGHRKKSPRHNVNEIDSQRSQSVTDITKNTHLFGSESNIHKGPSDITI